MLFPPEWAVPLNVLLIGINLGLGVRLGLRRRRAQRAPGAAATTWGRLPYSFHTASVVVSILVLTAASDGDGPATVTGATYIALMSAATALLLPLAGRRGPGRADRALADARLALPFALAGHALAAATVVVSHLLISPSPLAGELAGHGLTWGLLDKRWIVASYVLAVSLVLVLPIFLRRLFELADAAPEPPGADPLPPERRRRTFGLGLRTLACLVASIAIATWLFAESFVEMSRYLDPHELVHLGAFQAIRQGLAPYLEAETQYGPGHQLLTYRMMERTDFSLYGFRMSHLLVNLAAMAVVYFCYLMTFRGRVAAVLILFSLWMSPAAYFEFYGWAVVPRWLGPVLVGVLLPSIVLRPQSRLWRSAASFLLGAACGLLSWIASENLFGCIISFTLACVVFWSIRVLTTRTVLEMAASWLAGLASTLTLSCLAVFEPGQIGRAAQLYFRTGSLVSSGFSNTPWNSYRDPWTLAYFATPYLLVLTGLAAVYLPELAGIDRKAQQARVRILGLLSAAIVLQIVALLRSDSFHFVAPSMALGALIVLCLFELPAMAARRGRSRRQLRLGLLAGVLVFCPAKEIFERVQKRAPFHPRHAEAVLEYLVDLAAPAPARAGPADAARRLGWEAHPDEISSYETFLTYREWLDMMDHIAEQVAGRKAVVSRFDDVLPSAIYFFSNLQVVLAVEPMMSIWTRDDVERWKSKLEARDVECLVSTHDDDPVAAAVLTSFDRYSTHRVDAPIAFEIHCRDE